MAQEKGEKEKENSLTIRSFGKKKEKKKERKKEQNKEEIQSNVRAVTFGVLQVSS